MIGVYIPHSMIIEGNYILHLREDVFSWLLEHVGDGARNGGFAPGCSWLWSYKTDQPLWAVVVFSDPEAAMLFKLTFG